MSFPGLLYSLLSSTVTLFNFTILRTALRRPNIQSLPPIFNISMALPQFLKRNTPSNLKVSAQFNLLCVLQFSPSSGV